MGHNILLSGLVAIVVQLTCVADDRMEFPSTRKVFKDGKSILRGALIRMVKRSKLKLMAWME